MPRVSVIVPCYNYGRYLGRCVGSILGQKGFSDLEVIVVDDASSDETPAVLESFSDPRLRILRHEKNRGHIATKNEGFAQASGAYFAQVDADDYWHPEYLATTVPLLERHPEVGAVHTEFDLVDDEGKVTEERASGRDRAEDFKGNELAELLEKNFMPPVSTLFRREALELVGGSLRADIPCSEEWLLWLHLGTQTEFYYVARSLAYYRVHGTNLHSGLGKNRQAEPSEKRVLDEFFALPLPGEIQKLKRAAYATLYRRHVDQHLGFGRRGDALRCLVRAAAFDPTWLLEKRPWIRLAGSVLPPALYRGIKRAVKAG